MKSKIMLTLIACALVACLGPLSAGEEAAKPVKLEGWIVDSWCGKDNANAKGKDCALECHKKGADLVFFSDGKIYKLSDQKAAVAHVGHKVQAVGTVEGETLKVAQYTTAEEDEKKEPTKS